MTSATAIAPTARGYDAANASDRTLMVRIADRDAEAFEELYRRHSRRALMQARKLCATKELAEEVVQETFISLWRGAHLYRSGLGSVSAWLSGMVRNRAIDAWRRAAVRPVEVAAFEDGSGQLPSAVDSNTLAPERADVLSLIAELPAAQKEAIFLAYFGDMTHTEIAARADAPLGTIKGRIRLGLEKLRCGYEESRATQAEPEPSWPACGRSRRGSPILRRDLDRDGDARLDSPRWSPADRANTVRLVARNC